MNAKATKPQRAAPADTDADIDQFLVDNHHDIAAKLAAGREQIARGEAAPLEPLDALLRDARAAR
jgi:hypothetical protein